MMSTAKSKNRKKPGPPPLPPEQRRVGMIVYVLPRTRAKATARARKAGVSRSKWGGDVLVRELGDS